MGRKRTVTGKHVHCCIALLACLLLSQCVAFDRSPPVQRSSPQDESSQHPLQAQKPLAQGGYETALEENQKETKEFRRVAVAKQQPKDESRQHLVQAQKLLARGDYETALKENQKALSLSANNPPGDEALYNMALVYTCPGNPKRDSVKSIATFKRLIKDYPQSAWTEQAKIWVQVIQEGENAKRVAATVTHENDKLKGIIEESKKVDLEIEAKKKEQAK
jgi:tetratricopeptide (TPR) repeat protein